MKAQVFAFIFNIISYTDEVNQNNQPAPRTTFVKAHYRGTMTLRQKLLDLIEVSHCSKDKPLNEVKDEDVEWSPYGEKLPEGRQKLGERFKDGELILTVKEKDALKFYYNDRDELPLIEEENFDEFEKLIA